MLDNPQSKLNQQASQNNQGFNQQNSQKIPVGSPPQLRPDTSPKLNSTVAPAELKNPESGDTQKVPENQKKGFAQRMKEKLQGAVIKGAMDRFAPQQQPDAKSRPQHNSQIESAPETNVSRPNIPKVPQNSPASYIPQAPKMQMPKIPKMRK